MNIVETAWLPRKQGRFGGLEASGPVGSLRVVNASPTPPGFRAAPLAAAALAVATLVGTGLWLRQRSAEQERLADRAAAYADVPLPGPDTPLDPELAALGADLFEAHCAACHAVTGQPKLGPNLSGITSRRDVAWIRAMILHPDSMTVNDPVAAALKQERGGVQMLVVGDVGPADARAIIEFFRRVDAQGGG